MIILTRTPQTICVTAPYDAAFITAAKQLGGKFNRATTTWEFPTRYEQQVRSLCREIYGSDGTPTAAVTVHVHLSNKVRYDDEIKLGGLTLLKKFERDVAPRLGENVAVIAGQLLSRGGSRANPSITVQDDTTLEVLNVPKLLARRLAETDPEILRKTHGYRIEIVAAQTDDNVLTPTEESLLTALQALAPERLQLVLRILNQ